MKKSIIFLMTVICLNACKKSGDLLPSPPGNERILEHRKNAVKELEIKYPGLLIKETYSGNAGAGYKFDGDGDLEQLIANLYDQIEQAYSPVPQTISISLVNNPDLEFDSGLPAPDAGCGFGNYLATGINSGGLFSSFQFSYNYAAGGISNVGLNLVGAAIGWTWSSGQSYFNGLSGYTLGYSTYSLLGTSFTFPNRLNWIINPANCTMTYWWS